MSEQVTLIGPQPEEQAASRLADDIVYAITDVLSEYDTEALLAAAEYRDKIRSDGWLGQMIREYVEVWR